jgi:mono/diheme cytochrome c family protein
MKKSALAIVSVFVLVLITAAAFTPSGKSSSPTPKGIPDSVFAVFQKSCITCHANDGNGMAKSHVNFDNWDTYTAEKQASKATDICKQLSKGSMPPGGFRKNNPDLVPTAADVKKVCDWAHSLNP